jgi:predicted ABC-type transport system involved in lysophospholipase L1 biosynthesis ATPase subunit
MISAPSNSSKTPVLEMTGVSVGSWNDPDTAIVEEVNWSVEAGEYWLLGGMHGSGKSDFLAMTDGLMYPLKGSYRLYGREMPGVGDELLAERLRVGLVFDGGQLFHHLTIEENIALPLRYHRALARGDLKNNVKTILDATGLSPWAGRLPGTPRGPAAGQSFERTGLPPATVVAGDPRTIIGGRGIGGGKADDAGGHGPGFAALAKPGRARRHFAEGPVSFAGPAGAIVRVDGPAGQRIAVRTGRARLNQRYKLCHYKI